MNPFTRSTYLGILVLLGSGEEIMFAYRACILAAFAFFWYPGPAFAECPPNLKGKITPSNVPIGTIIANIIPPEFFLECAEPIGAWAYSSGYLLEDEKQKQSGFFKFLIAKRSNFSNDLFSGDIVRVPDLRGVFLRGLNDGRPGSVGDPDGGSRRSGDYQSDAILAHRHGYLHGTGKKTAESQGNQYELNPIPEKKPKTEGQFRKNSNEKIEGNETRARNVAVYFYIRVLTNKEARRK